MKRYPKVVSLLLRTMGCGTLALLLQCGAKKEDGLRRSDHVKFPVDLISPGNPSLPAFLDRANKDEMQDVLALMAKADIPATEMAYFDLKTSEPPGKVDERWRNVVIPKRALRMMIDGHSAGAKGIDIEAVRKTYLTDAPSEVRIYDLMSARVTAQGGVKYNLREIASFYVALDK